jgi:hypothetical protein
MSSRLKHGLLISIAVIALFIVVEHGYGAVIEYNYDASGNLIEKRIQTDTTPPVTTPDPPGGTYFSPLDVTLSCQDGTGSGCDKTYYTTDGSTPTTSSPVYSSPIHISVATTLKFFSKDLAGNSETVKTHNYIMGGDTTPPTTTPSPPEGAYNAPLDVSLTCDDGSGSGCDKIYYTTDGSTPTTSSPVYSSPIIILVNTTLKFFAVDFVGNTEAVKTQNYTIATVRIGGSAYTSLQAAYNAAANGDVIKCRAMTFVENLTVNRNITVTLDGGYDSTFTTNAGGQTTIKGMLTTTVGGGTITIKNFVLEN